MAKVSIIVPIYNVEPYLAKCIDSILEQTYKDFECILVNDGSTDNCGEICEQYANKDDRIKVVYKENGGLSSARNAGLDLATGEYVCFIDSDDYIHCKYLEALMSAMTAHNTSMALCVFCRVESDDVDTNDEFSFDDSLHVYSVEDLIADRWHWVETNVMWNKLFKRELFDNIRFPLGRINEDEYIKPLLYDQMTQVAIVEYPLYFYRQRQGSIIRSKFSIKKLDKLEAISQNIDFFIQKRNKQAVENEVHYFFSYYFKYIFEAMSSDSDSKTISCIKKNKKLFNKYFLKLLGNKRISARSKYMIILYFLFPVITEKRYGASYKD